jgi:hypothetical protein
MGAKIGTGNVLFRVGSGSPAKVFLGTAAVQTVPGAPVITAASDGSNIEFTPPADGGSPILGYNIYVDGVLEVSNEPMVIEGILDTPLAAAPGADVEIAAVNAIGEGPRSAPVTIS